MKAHHVCVEEAAQQRGEHRALRNACTLQVEGAPQPHHVAMQVLEQSCLQPPCSVYVRCNIYIRRMQHGAFEVDETAGTHL
jgi:hypothetical protein